MVELLRFLDSGTYEAHTAGTNHHTCASTQADAKRTPNAGMAWESTQSSNLTTTCSELIWLSHSTAPFTKEPILTYPFIVVSGTMGVNRKCKVPRDANTA